jgi:hypothetical protein
MKKNVASQVIGCQMASATDGGDFTGSVTVYVTGDAGTQAVGSVGSGACTHEGNGFHTYAPAQAETNYDHVAFTFKGSGAITATVQVYTTFPQTGDAFARLGAPAGSSVSADVAAVKSETAAILADTTEIGAAGAGLTALASAANLATLAGYVDTEVAAVKAKTDNLPASPAATEDCLTAAGVRTAIGLASANLDTQLDALPTNSELSAALASADDAVLTQVALVKAKTDGLTFTVAGAVDANIQRINDVTITGNGGVGTEFGV